MRNIERLSAIYCASVVFGCGVLRADIEPPRITSIAISNNQVLLAWTNGHPTFRVQTRSDLTQDWVNVGATLTNPAASIPLNAGQAYFRVVSDYTARYRVDFNATWSAVTHPESFPSGSAHFSGLVGCTHNESRHFFRQGETASEGIRLMAELGQKTALLNEISAVMADGAADFQLSGGGIGSSPGSVSLTFPQPMRRDFPLVTLVSMIAPSPDWFVGVESLSLIENEHWLTNKVVTLYGMDAGTDSGASYASPDQVTVPRGLVTEFTDFPALVNGVIVPFGTFTFTRLD